MPAMYATINATEVLYVPRHRCTLVVVFSFSVALTLGGCVSTYMCVCVFLRGACSDI